MKARLLELAPRPVKAEKVVASGLSVRGRIAVTDHVVREVAGAEGARASELHRAGY